MKKLTVYCLGAVGLSALAVLLRIVQIVFFVDNIDCLISEKGFSYWTFVVVVLIAVMFTVLQLILLRNRDFIAADKAIFEINRNIVPAFVIVSNLAFLGYSVYNGGGYFNSSSVTTAVYAVLTVLFVGFCVFIIMSGENYLNNKFSFAVALAPVMLYLFRLIMIFIYYTSNHRDFNYKETILATIALLLFFLYFAYHSYNGQYAKRIFVFGLFAIFAVFACWLPPVLTIRSAPVFNNDTIYLLLNSLVDISSAVFAYSVLRIYCKNSQK